MKRIRILFLSIILPMILLGQNANRKGLFAEIGLGGLVGSTVQTKVSVVDNYIMANCPHGMSVNFGVGGLIPVHDNWAYEPKVGMYSSTSDFNNGMIFYVFPIGFRYSTPEIWKNNSLYVHLNIGCAVSKTNGRIKELPSDSKIEVDDSYSSGISGLYPVGNIIFPNMPERAIRGSGAGYGIAYSIGFGLNLTTRLFVEVSWNGQTFIDCYGRTGKAALTGGTLGASIGFRFM